MPQVHFSSLPLALPLCQALFVCKTVSDAKVAVNDESGQNVTLVKSTLYDVKVILKEHSREVLAQESADFTQGPLMSSCKHF